MAVRDYARAGTWCDRIAAFADAHGSRFMLAFCRAEYGAVDLWRGRWSAAEEILEASLEDFAHSRPAWARMPLAGLAELRRRQGRAEEALQLLEDAGPSAAAQLCRARLALDGGDARAAAELAERVLRQAPEERLLDRAPALEVRVRSALACGEPDAAAAALASLRAVQRAVGTPPLGAGADLAEGLVAAAAGDHERARPLLEDAVDGFEHSGGLYDAAQARLALAASLFALGRADAATREATVALTRLEGLGAAADAERARALVRAAGGGEAPTLPGVTPREREVLRLLAEGLTNRQIAERLVVSEHTVHRHVTNILRKLGLPSRAAAAALAVRAGMLA
jgi:DNA-binding NarL/FixJ family response regulator